MERSLNAQINILLMDGLGLCFFSFLTGNTELFTRLINSLLGLELNMNDVIDISKTALKEEIAFNQKAGISDEGNSLPEFLKNEQLYPKNAVFDVPKKELQEIFSSI